jgi:hypothetical protein
MATAAQIAANRRNALRSTGPKSQKGKDKSRANPIRHGLYAADLMALGEDSEAFTAYAAALAVTFQPQDTYEELLVRRIALASWRSDRLAKLEAALLDGEAQREARRRGYPVDLPVDVWPDALVPLARHEAALDRAIQRAVTLLERHRAARGRGEMPSSFQTSLLEGEGNKNFVEQSQFCQPIQSACPTEANVEANLGRHPASSSTASPSIAEESGGDIATAAAGD